MRLWQKNFSVTAALFTGVLFVCAAVLIVPVVRMTLDGAKTAALNEEKAIAHVLDGPVFVERQAGAQVVQGLARHYAQNGSFLSVRDGETTLADTLPFAVDVPVGTLRWIRHDGRFYVAIGDAFSDESGMVYLSDVTGRVRAAVREGAGAVGICLVLTCLVNAALYYTMRGINRPLSRLSHELRTPLTVIRGYAEMLQLAALSDEQRHNAASYIVGECDRLRDIAQKLLAMNGQGRIERERIPLEALAERLRMAWDGVRIEKNGEGESVYGDPTLLTSLLDNLIGNAKKAAPGGTVLVTLSERAFAVCDDGCGMDERMLAYVNDPQHRERPDGIYSGLGVPLCHEIAHLHGARLRYTSERGAGTTAEVLFYNSETTL